MQHPFQSSLIYTRGRQSSEKLNNLSKATVTKGKARVWTLEFMWMHTHPTTLHFMIKLWHNKYPAGSGAWPVNNLIYTAGHEGKIRKMSELFG